MAYKLLHLHENGFITNTQFFSNPSKKLGLEVGCQGDVFLFGELIILTPAGLGYLKTNDILEQIVKKSIAELGLSPEKEITVYHKIWQEVKDTGIDFMVKLTKSFVSNP